MTAPFKDDRPDARALMARAASLLSLSTSAEDQALADAVMDLLRPDPDGTAPGSEEAPEMPEIDKDAQKVPWSKAMGESRRLRVPRLRDGKALARWLESDNA